VIYCDDVSAGEMWKKMRLFRGGLEAAETVSIMPVSLVTALKGPKAGRYLERYALMMLKGTLDTATGTDWGSDHGQRNLGNG
jgi:hypothetical protein